jgi:hypothetical protein
MRERIDLQARWGDRRESVDDCAGHAAECLRLLAACDESFIQWFKLGNSRKEALTRRFEPTFESCRDLLAKGCNRRDSDKSVIENLGFRMALWSGSEDDSAVGIRFHGGAYPAVPRMPNPNDGVVDLPYGGSAGERILEVNRLRQILSAVVEGWNPDWARVSTFHMREAIYPRLYQGVEVGWLTFFSDRYGPLPKLPDGYEVIRIENLGSLIVIRGIDRLTASNSAHVDAVRRLSEVLETAGLLVPTPPHILA